MDEWLKVSILAAVVVGILGVSVAVAAAWFGFAKWAVAFTVLTALFSAASAAFWLLAALLPIPRQVRNSPHRNPNPDLDVVLRRLRRQSQWNALAASSMFIAVLFQLCALEAAL